MHQRSINNLKETILWAGIILFCHVVSGQERYNDPGIPYPAEEIQVHLTQTYLFPGEVLGFAIYCTNPLFPELELSRMAFIELVSDRNTSVLRKKVLLEQGKGSGVFILPDNLESGIYTIMAYTNWLKNFGEDAFFYQNVLIINPEQAATHGMDTSGYSLAYIPWPENINVAEDGIRLFPDKNKYAAREKVNLNIMPVKDGREDTGWVFSISVNLKEPALNSQSHNKPEKQPDIQADDIVYLPDFKGIRLTGKIENTSGALRGARIIISEPGPGTDIQSTLSDAEGNFHFLLEPEEGGKDIVFTLPGNDARIRLEEPFWNGFRNPPVRQVLYLNKNLAAYLEGKYIHLQLQQKFNRENFMQADQLNGQVKDNERFYHHQPRIINIDDYVLLDSLPEYFYELVPSVKYTFARGKYDIKVLDKVNKSYFDIPPGVFIDGVLFSDYNQIARIPVPAIKSIRVLPELYYYHDLSFGGIIDLHTKKSDFTAVQLLPNMTRLVFPLASYPEMEYHPVDYSVPGTDDRSPDFRHLLCWEPQIIVGAGGENTIQLYTGDVSGEFIVRVAGISSQGKINRFETSIFVEAAPFKAP